MVEISKLGGGKRLRLHRLPPNLRSAIALAFKLAILACMIYLGLENDPSAYYSNRRQLFGAGGEDLGGGVTAMKLDVNVDAGRGLDMMKGDVDDEGFARWVAEASGRLPREHRSRVSYHLVMLAPSMTTHDAY